MMHRVMLIGGLLAALLSVDVTLAAAPALADPGFQVEYEFLLDGDVILSETLEAAGRPAAASAFIELEGTTYRYAHAVLAAVHSPVDPPDLRGFVPADPAWQAALQRAVRFTCNGIDLALFHPQADACRVAAAWSELDSTGQAGTAGMRTACVRMHTPATRYFNVELGMQPVTGTRGGQLLGTPQSLRRGPDSTIEPLDTFSILFTEAKPDAASAGSEKSEATGGAPLQLDRSVLESRPRDRRPVAVHADRVVRFDAGVLEGRTLYYLDLEFFRGGESINQVRTQVLDQPVVPSSMVPAQLYIPQPDATAADAPQYTLTADFHYYVRALSADGYELLRSVSSAAGVRRSAEGEPGGLPVELTEAMEIVEFAGLSFEIYYPGATSVEISVRSQTIPSYYLTKEVGELLPELISRQPHDIEDLGAVTVLLATPDIGEVTVPGRPR